MSSYVYVDEKDQKQESFKIESIAITMDDKTCPLIAASIFDFYQMFVNFKFFPYQRSFEHWLEEENRVNVSKHIAFCDGKCKVTTPEEYNKTNKVKSS
jgi:hypothetical protein